MSDWTPIQFVPLEWTAIRLHQIFKEWPLYSGEMTISIFLPRTNLRFLIIFWGGGRGWGGEGFVLSAHQAEAEFHNISLHSE